MKSNLKNLLLVGLIAVSVFSMSLVPFMGVSAQTDIPDEYGLKTAAEKAKLNVNVSLPELIGTIIQYLLQLIGVLLVVLLLYGGFMWMTAAGNTEKTKKARGIITNAIIGLIIVLAAYSIANFVIGRLSGIVAG